MQQFNPLQSINAFQAGTQAREKREMKNAFADAGKAYMSGDYKGAAGALMPYDMGAGIQMAQYGQQQGLLEQERQKTAQQEQLKSAMSLTENLLQVPEAARGQYLMNNWQAFEPIMGKDFMTFWNESGGDVSDSTLQQELGVIRTQLGMGAPEKAEAYTLAPGARRYVGSELVAENPKPTEADKPDWQRVTVSQNGAPVIMEYDRNAPDPQSTMRKIGSQYVEPDPDAGMPDVSGEGQLRREFNSLTSDFRDVHQAYNRITATDTSTPAGQMGLIFQYMKMLDPGSTVREGEYATAQNTTGVPGQVMNAYNKALAGEFLNLTQIKDFEAQAASLYNRASQIYETQINDYRRLSSEYQFSPDRTVVDVRGFFEPVSTQQAPPPQFPNAPAVGAIEDGYRYIGGDPSQPASWEPVD